jgi:polyadenylate-binding protein
VPAPPALPLRPRLNTAACAACPRTTTHLNPLALTPRRAPAARPSPPADLDRDVTEAQLFSTFSPFGTVTSMRICRDAITRKSLGYAYVNFASLGDAANAMRELNYTKLRERPLRIMWVQRDPSLRRSAQGNVFVKNLDPAVDSRVLSENFSLFGSVVSCRVVVDEAGKSKGYGFVQFDSDDAARRAIEELNGAPIAGRTVYVGPFKRREARSAST